MDPTPYRRPAAGERPGAAAPRSPPSTSAPSRSLTAS